MRWRCRWRRRFRAVFDQISIRFRSDSLSFSSAFAVDRSFGWTLFFDSSSQEVQEAQEEERKIARRNSLLKLKEGALSPMIMQARGFCVCGAGTGGDERLLEALPHCGEGDPTEPSGPLTAFEGLKGI